MGGEGSHEARIAVLEQHVSEVRVKQAEMDAKIDRQAESIDKLLANTEDIVVLLQGGQAFGKVVAWSAGLGATATGLWHFIKDGFK